MAAGDLLRKRQSTFKVDPTLLNAPMPFRDTAEAKKGRAGTSPRKLSVKRPKNDVERAVYETFGMEPGIKRPGLIPLARNPDTGEIELTAPQPLYDLARAFAAPAVALEGGQFDPQEEALNLAMNVAGAGGARSLAARPLEGGAVELGMAGGRRGIDRAAAIASEFGPSIARRLDGMIEPEAPLSVWRKAAENLAATEGANAPRLTRVKRFGSAPYEPSEFDVKVRDKPATQGMRGLYEEKSGVQQPAELSIQNLIGRPFITSMSDRTAAMRRLLGVNNTIFDTPVELLGGQDFMFDPTTQGLVWASDPGVVSGLRAMAQMLADKYGTAPLYLPFRMAGSGSDFSNMTGETMMRFAAENMGKSDLRRANKALNEGLPWQEKFAGLETPEGIAQYRALPGGSRVKFSELLGGFAPEGGLTQGQTRLLIADPRQVDAPKFGLQNVGEIDPSGDVLMGSGHPAYFGGLRGQGLGTLAEDDINVMELLPELAKRYRIENPDQFVGSPVKLTPEEAAIHGASRMDPGRLMRMAPQSGFIDEDIVAEILRRRRERGE